MRTLDDLAFQAHLSGLLTTGGTTLLIHVVTQMQLWTANVGDCKVRRRGMCSEERGRWCGFGRDGQRERWGFHCSYAA